MQCCNSGRQGRGGGAGLTKGELTRGELIFGAAFRSRGHVYNGLKQYDNAIKDFNKFFELAEHTSGYNGLKTLMPVSYADRAVAYYNIGKYQNAISDLTARDDYTRKDLPMLWNEDARFRQQSAAFRGDIAMAMKQYDLAAQYYEDYFKAYPTVAGLAEKIALARRLAGTPSLPSPPPEPVGCKLYPNLC